MHGCQRRTWNTFYRPIIITGPAKSGYFRLQPSRGYARINSHEALRHLRSIKLDKNVIRPSRVAVFLSVVGVGLLVYHARDVERLAIATIRSTRLATAAALCAWDYKSTFSKNFNTENERLEEYSECHKRSAARILAALLANGGIFIKLVRMNAFL